MNARAAASSGASKIAMPAIGIPAAIPAPIHPSAGAACRQMRLEVGSGPTKRTTSFLVSFSQAWLVTNLDEMLSLLRYFPESERLATLKKAPASIIP